MDFSLPASVEKELGRIAEIAGYLWMRNWAEANGGNISVNLTHLMPEVSRNYISEVIQEIREPVPLLDGNVFYVTGTGKRMRDVARSPLEHGAVIQILNQGKGCSVISPKIVKPTSELVSHLLIHNHLKATGLHKSVVLHTHPTELIALTHCRPFLDPEFLTRMLWSMIPETRVLVPKGIGIVPYILTGTSALAKATIKQLEKHRVLLWEKHGAIAVGEDIAECFDIIDTLTKSAQIYLNARMAGYEPEGLSDEQSDELAKAFNLL